jgi:putative ABC transport system permease protein
LIAVALRGLAGRKLRASLTALAVVLGVAMISGTFILTDTIKAGFDTIIGQSFENTDAVITGKSAISDEASAAGFPAAVLDQVRALPDVAAASGAISDTAKLIDRKGKTIGSGLIPGLALSVDPKNPQFEPLKLVAGRWPAAPSEVAIDQKTSAKKHFRVGETIGVSTLGPVRRFTISGIANFGSNSSFGSATMAIFDIPTAQQLFHKVGKFDAARVEGKRGVSPSQLAAEVRKVLPPTARVRTTDAETKSEANGANGFLNFLQKFLLAFGGIALFVGSFVIANTLSITIAQRMREFATLRTIGASRRQVLWSVILEALVVGALASVLGLFVGLGLAKGLDALFVAFGFDLPKGSTVFATRTIVVSLIVGILVTLLASLRPAFRATRVPAIAAVREGAVLPKSRFARFGLATALVVLGVGIALLVYGVFAPGVAIGLRVLALVLGVLLLFAGVTMNAHRLVRPLASVLGWPGARVGGVAGSLARDNAVRNPSRTASTASALMIGITLITFVAVLGQGVRSSFEDAVDKLFVADYAITSTGFGFEPFTKEAAGVVRKAPGVEAASSIRNSQAKVFGSKEDITAVDKDMTKVISLEWYRGSDAVPARLGGNGAFVEKKYAKEHHLVLGSPVKLRTPTGQTLPLIIKGIFKEPKGGSPFGTVTFSTQAFDAAYPQPKDIYAFVKIRGGVNDANTQQLKRALKGFPGTRIQTQSQFKKNQEKFINVILNMLYVLLGLSIVVSLFGIVNTLVLTVFERTRELGMLRAVGMTRRQVRRMIRHESVVTSLIGAALGIALGFFLSLLVTQALSSEGIVFAVPYLPLALFVLAAIAAGILAAIFPARRASRLRILRALQYE